MKTLTLCPTCYLHLISGRDPAGLIHELETDLGVIADTDKPCHLGRYNTREIHDQGFNRCDCCDWPDWDTTWHLVPIIEED